ncbi:hypothetical protein HK100_005297 [Physocladia obscura]|uniref:Uncharacterized protein n=1 Tax=Physocladia obscura TaxID=109957 RepID=A0AAD5T6L6_9FUNG|nr:hypothetical protein HK100_005297 [Physocladia obscura]
MRASTGGVARASIKSLPSIVPVCGGVDVGVVRRSFAAASTATTTKPITPAQSASPAIVSLLSSKSVTGSRVLASSPHPTSQIRLLKYIYPSANSASPHVVSQEVKDYHAKRTDLQKMHHLFWEANNKHFMEAKQAFEDAVLSNTGVAATANDFSRFYKAYLEENQQRHMEYNQKWWAENWAMIGIALRAEFVPTERVSEIVEGLAVFGRGMKTLVYVLIGMDPQARKSAHGVSVR